jgi:hypothetical protein
MQRLVHRKKRVCAIVREAENLGVARKAALRNDLLESFHAGLTNLDLLNLLKNNLRIATRLGNHVPPGGD